MQISSGKLATIIVFVIIPVIYMILSIIQLHLPQLTYILRPIERFYPFSIYSYPLPPLPLTLVLLTFAFIPAIYSTPKFFKKKGFVNVIIEYEYLKKILYISIPILIALTGSYFYVNQLVLEQEEEESKLSKQSFEAFSKYMDSKFPFVDLLDPLRILFFTTALVAVSIIIKLLLQHSRKEFTLYYAKGCFKIVSNKDNSKLDKAKYFKTGLIWYNKFLKKNIGLHINDIMKIYTKIITDSIITDSPLEQNSALISISESFNSEDKFKPFRYISAFIPDKELGQALTEQSIRSTIKESSDLLIPIITIIITIITNFLLPKH